MLKLVLFVLGAAGGVAASSLWLLVDSAPDVAGAAPPTVRDRIDHLRRRFDLARLEGARAREETENRLRHELAAFRRHPDRPGTSSST